MDCVSIDQLIFQSCLFPRILEQSVAGLVSVPTDFNLGHFQVREEKKKSSLDNNVECSVILKVIH